MDLKRSGSQPSGKGPAEYFTGNVRIDPLFEAPDPARARGASVTFEPGTRTARLGRPWSSRPGAAGCKARRSKNGNTTGRRGLVPAGVRSIGMARGRPRP
jgi:hypothetical protein